MEHIEKILLVADYGKDDLAFYEAKQRLEELAAASHIRIQVDMVSVDPFDRAQTAAVVAQAAASGKYDVIYHNTAPRKDKKAARINNAGEELAYAVVGNVKIVGVNSGDEHTVNTFSLLPAGTQAYEVKCDNNKTQFRSRDIYPQEVIAAIKGEIKTYEKPLTISQPVDETKVAQANRIAGELLKDAQPQKSRHGDASQGYVTIIGSQRMGHELLDEAKSRHSDAEVDFIPLKSARGEWIEAAFVIAQLALNSNRPEQRTLVALTKSESTLQSAETLYEAELDNGARVITDDIKALTFVKGRLSGKGEVKAYAKQGPGFTTRGLAKTAPGGALTVIGTPQTVPFGELDAAARLPEHITPAYTDGYGNVKLAIPHTGLSAKLGVNAGGEHALKAGERAVAGIQVGDRRIETAYIAPGSFCVADGEVALSKGSSGWKNDPHGDVDHFAEIFFRGDNAAKELGYPQPGDHITVNWRRNEVAPLGTEVETEGLGIEPPSRTVTERAAS